MKVLFVMLHPIYMMLERRVFHTELSVDDDIDTVIVCDNDRHIIYHTRQFNSDDSVITS